MTRKNRVICLVLTNNSDPWLTIYHDGAKPTWIEAASKMADIYSYTGKKPSVSARVRERLTGRLRHTKFAFMQIFIDKNLNSIFARYPDQQTLVDRNICQQEIELHSTIGTRTLSAFEYLLNLPDWEYLWRANVSNYVQVSKLLELIEKLPNRRLAAGVINYFGDTPYLSGAGYLLSRDVVARIVENSSAWKNYYLDDVALGFVLYDLKIDLLPIERLTVSKVTDLEAISDADLRDFVSFRCNGRSDRGQDVQIMKEIHRRLLGS